MKAAYALLVASMAFPGIAACADDPATWVWNDPREVKIPGVRHGTIESPSLKRTVGFNVYVPREYEKESGKRYPVVYFLHGAGGTESSDVGLAGLVHAEIEAGRIEPTIYVFPNGGKTSGYRDSKDASLMVETCILRELLPRIDAEYRTIARPEARGVCGFSMGGGGAMRWTLKHPDLFGAAASLAGGIEETPGAHDGDSCYAYATALSSENRARLRLYLVVGEDDFLFPRHAPFLARLKELGIATTFVVHSHVGHDLGALTRLSGGDMIRHLARELAARESRGAAQKNLGPFEGRSDVGAPSRGGSAEIDSVKKSARVSGGGKNMWFAEDAFHFVWRKASGDVSIAADVQLEGQGGDPHRKACLIVRQSLDADAAYADAALHGDGLTSLQYREAKGAPTREIQANVAAPRRLRLEKRGKYVSMSIAREGEALEPAGGSFRLELADPFYVGLAVCAHDDGALESAAFSNIEISDGALPTGSLSLRSTLETITLASRDRRAVWSTKELIEAPSWTRDGAALIFNAKGRLLRIPATGGEPQGIDTGFATRCNNDHGISPDGTRLVISDQSQGDRRSRIYTLPIAGGAPVLVTESAPSYWHCWSPDGRTLAYCAERNGEFDVYTIPAGGGTETRLTTAKGLDDGPDYSADGTQIYFNSDRTGSMKIWRMKSDGSAQEQVTNGELNDWFPHPSPDGKWVVFLSYEADVKGHPENRDVQLRLYSIADGSVATIAKLFGGQGTINVPSWSPDSRKLAFVSYQLAP